MFRLLIFIGILSVFSTSWAQAQTTSTQVVNNRLRIITNNEPVADFGSDFITLNKPLAVQTTPTYANEATSKQYVDTQIAAQIAQLKSEIALLQVQLNLFNRNTAVTSNAPATTTTNNVVSAVVTIPNTLAANIGIGGN